MRSRRGNSAHRHIHSSPVQTQLFNLAKHNVKSFTHIFNKESKYAAAIPLQKRIFAPGKPIHGNVRQSFDTKSRRKLQMPPLRGKRKSIIRSLSNALRQNTQRLF